MDEIKLPHHVVDRFECRWKARFAQLLEGQSLRRSASGNDDPLQSRDDLERENTELAYPVALCPSRLASIWVGCKTGGARN